MVAHCPNTGAMRGLLKESVPVFVSRAVGAGRRCPYTWQAVLSEGTLVGINTHLPNQIVSVGLKRKIFLELADFDLEKKEVTVEAGVRLDFYLKRREEECYLEVKNVHYQEKGVAIFPDSVTDRGRKHLEVLTRLCLSGKRSVVLYIVQRNDCQAFSHQSSFDPLYAEAARKASLAGVEFYAYDLEFQKGAISLGKQLPEINLDGLEVKNSV